MEKITNNVGFCVFGHAFGHQCVSNGLISALNLQDETCITFPKGIVLNKENKPVSIISREILSDGKEIIKIFIVNFAESQTVKRDGETVGCAIVFSGTPSSLLLNKAVKKTFQESQKLIDKNFIFKTQDINGANVDLINPSANGLIEGELLKRVNNRDVAGVFGVLSDGNIINQIMPIVQAFIYNPNFKNIEKLYVSEEISFLKKLFEDKIITFRHILDYSKYHKSHLEKLSNQQKQIKQNEEKLASFERDYESNRLSRENTLNDLLEKQNQYKNTLNQLKEKEDEIKSRLSNNIHLLKEKQKQTEELSSKISQKDEELRKMSSKIKEIRINKFQELLNHKDFQNEKIIYEQQFKKREDILNRKIEKLEYQLEEERERPIISKQIVIVLGSIALLFFIGGGYLGYKWNNSGNNIAESLEQSDKDKTSEKASTKIKETPKDQMESPIEYNVADFLSLSTEKQASHKKELDEFLKKIEIADTSKIDLSNLFERKWNFAEIIDYNKEAIDAGLTRLKRIKSIYENLGQPTSFFTDQFMINSNGNLRSETLNFNSTKRNEILKKYLSESGNIYKDLNLQTEDIQDFEKDLPLLYMHFRWVVYNLSEYKEGNSPKDADILKTNKTKHIVPLKN
jgi:hypothetical protein